MPTFRPCLLRPALFGSFLRSVSDGIKLAQLNGCSPLYLFWRLWFEYESARPMRFNSRQSGGRNLVRRVRRVFFALPCLGQSSEAIRSGDECFHYCSSFQTTGDYLEWAHWVRRIQKLCEEVPVRTFFFASTRIFTLDKTGDDIFSNECLFHVADFKLEHTSERWNASFEGKFSAQIFKLDSSSTQVCPIYFLRLIFGKVTLVS